MQWSCLVWLCMASTALAGDVDTLLHNIVNTYLQSCETGGCCGSALQVCPVYALSRNFNETMVDAS